MAFGVPGHVAPAAGRWAAAVVLALALGGFVALALGIGPVDAASSLSLSKHSALPITQTIQVSLTTPLNGAGSCAAGADFTWDGVQLGIDAGGTATLGGCLYQARFNVPVAGHATPGPHTIAGSQCSNIATLVCDATTRAAATFTIDTPTIVLTPTSGLPSHTFTAVMTVPAADCAVPSSVQFRWEAIGGTLLGAPAFSRASCSATQTGIVPPAGSAPGPHIVTGMLCLATTGCLPTLAAAHPPTYTILVPPTASALPSQSLATASFQATFTATSPPPSPSPTATPTASLQATPAPTAAPTAAPTPAVGAVGGATSSQDPWLPPLVRDVPGASSLVLTPEVVITNGLLALFFMLLFAVTAEILNNTLDDHHAVISGWTDRLLHGRLRLLRPFASLEKGFDSLVARGRAGLVVHFAGVLLLLGLVYGFLSPKFGPNNSGVVLVSSVALGLGVLLYLNYGFKALIVRRWHHTPAGVRTYGAAILVAALCVTFSRFLQFHPGIVYGFVASLMVLAPLELSRRDDARLRLLPSAAVLVVGLAAFVALDPLRTAIGSTNSFLPSLAESMLVILYVGGLEGVAVNLLPVTYMDGGAVMRWNRLGWALSYSVVLFLWWQLLFNRDKPYADAFKQTGVLAVAVMLAFFMATTGVVWTYFRVRDAREARAALATVAAGED
jgi:hypothetical protein